MNKLYIGRSADNDIIINAPDVSRHHCIIIQDDYGRISVIDTNSSNGTFVNGFILRNRKIQLKENDVLTVGSTKVLWQKYFNTASTDSSKTCSEYDNCNIPYNNELRIGRGIDNHIRINDKFVSASHCRLIHNTNGFIVLIDNSSRNGTFVNGKRENYKILKAGDIVRIGNTILPWETYFPRQKNMAFYRQEDNIVMEPTGHKRSTDYESASYNDYEDTPEDAPKTRDGLATISLLVSLGGAALLLYCIILILKWGILAWIGSASTYILLSVGINIIAYVLAWIAKADDERDTSSANIAQYISGFCISCVIFFFIYWKFFDPNLMNPLKNLKF